MDWIYRPCSLVSIGAALLFHVGFQPLAAPSAQADEVRPRGSSNYEMVTGETGDDSEDTRRHWDSVYNTKTYVFGKEPASILKDNLKLLPVGRALDIAMGEGRNAVFLAKKGFSAEGVDISDVALRKARRLAKENGVRIKTVAADLMHYTIAPDTYTVIANIDYLQRSLIPQIKRGLKKGGVVVYENATIEDLANKPAQHLRREFLLNKGELKELFKEFEVLYYKESNDGKNAKASLIARKP